MTDGLRATGGAASEPEGLVFAELAGVDVWTPSASNVGFGGVVDLTAGETERPLVDGGEGYCEVGDVVQTGADVCDGESPGVERSATACRLPVVVGIAVASFLTGDASRIAVSFDALAAPVGALLPLRGFLARSLVGCTRKQRPTSQPHVESQEQR